VDDNAGSLTVDSPNLDVALSTRLKPADTLTKVATVDTITNAVTVTQATGTNLHVVVDSMPSVSANTSADVQAADDDSGYSDGDTGKSISQTPDGRLRVAAAAKVSDSRESYTDGQVRSLSLTTDGRLRVAASEAYSYIELFRDDGWLFNVPHQASVETYTDVNNNPWGF
jgi:hypothetical protein